MRATEGRTPGQELGGTRVQSRVRSSVRASSEYVDLSSPRTHEVLNQVDSRFGLVVAVAKRARQINEYTNSLGLNEALGIPGPQVHARSQHPLTIAMEELRAGKLEVSVPVDKESTEDVSPRMDAYRSLLVVEDVQHEMGQEVVDAVILNWDPYQTVHFPASIIPKDVRDKLDRDVYLFAWVNIGAERAEDLFFKDFELAPEPLHEDGLAG